MLKGRKRDKQKGAGVGGMGGWPENLSKTGKC